MRQSFKYQRGKATLNRRRLVAMPTGGKHLMRIVLAMVLTGSLLLFGCGRSDNTHFSGVGAPKPSQSTSPGGRPTLSPAPTTPNEVRLPPPKK
jgi:hypothetical protein